MPNLPGQRLSSNLIIAKIFCIFGVCLSLKMTIQISQDVNAIGFEGDKPKLFMIFFLGALGYLLTKPRVYYDETTLYIKKFIKKQRTIPLKNVRSFFHNPFSGSLGTSTFEIEFIDDTGEKGRVRFTGWYASNRINAFKDIAKKNNPGIEII